MKPGMTNSGSFQKGHKQTYTEERNEKVRQSKLGDKNPNYGNPDAAKHMQKRLTCPVCGATMNLGNYKRWKHGPSCSTQTSSS